MTPKPEAATVVFQDVTKRYADVVAVDNISFEIQAGKLVTLLGPSGCGKTTTLRMIAGLEMASEGRILIGGEDVTALSATRRDVTMVFQSYALFPHMSVLNNVLYGLQVAGRAPDAARQAAEDGLKLVGLAGLGDRLPAELSGGQQQRVAVARALVLEPSVLLFDEPLSNLDAKLRRRMREDIRALQQELGVTTVYVTHDQEEALSVSDTIIVMDRAVIVQQGTPRALYEAPVSRFVSTFIGDSNVVDATLERGDDAHGTVKIGTLSLQLPHRDLSDGDVQVAIRPRAIRLSRTSDNAAGIAATIATATYVGTHMEYTVSANIGELFVIDGRTQQPLAAGEAALISFGSEGVTLVPSPSR